LSDSTNPATSGRQFLRTLGLVALAISVTFTVDTFLAKTEESESRVEAARLFTEGQGLLQEGRYVEASGRLQDALTIQRGNRDYELALARAQLGAGQYPDAEATLNSLLMADSTDGPANLNMARVLVKESRVREAISYYHRAIYGTWTNNAAGNQTQVRFELIDLLAQQDSKAELLGELLVIEDQAPGDVATQQHIGSLFLEAGSPDRAAAVFQQLLKQQPDSAVAYAGLGESDFARGDYRAAVNDYSSALRLNPEDQTAVRKLDLCNRILVLDPTRRGLDPVERFRRSRVLLEMTAAAMEMCSHSELLDQAKKLAEERVTAARQDAAASADVDLAEELWQARTPGCGPRPDDPLALVLTKTAQ
jgi:tetratricopeptide (TPR) repeat protein